MCVQSIPECEIDNALRFQAQTAFGNSALDILPMCAGLDLISGSY